jgi:hypothetical protein
MAPFQIWLVKTLAGIGAVSVAPFMRTPWGWPTVESLHFIGLSLLVGNIFILDLRMLGLAKRLSIVAVHRLVPWGVAGFVINVITGFMFLVTEPDQYIYNPSFHFKLLLIATAGLNILAFYSTMYRQVKSVGPGSDAPRPARIVATVSLCVWIGVIIAGRLLTFYRPGECEPEGPGVIATCVPARD